MKIVLKNEQEYDITKAKQTDLFILRKNGYNVAGMIFVHRDHGYFMIDMKDGWSFTRVYDFPMDCVEEVLEKGYEIIKVIDNAEVLEKGYEIIKVIDNADLELVEV